MPYEVQTAYVIAEKLPFVFSSGMGGSYPIAKDYSNIELLFDIHAVKDRELCFNFVQVCEQAILKAVREQIAIEQSKASYKSDLKKEASEHAKANKG